MVSASILSVKVITACSSPNSLPQEESEIPALQLLRLWLQIQPFAVALSHVANLLQKRKSTLISIISQTSFATIQDNLVLHPGSGVIIFDLAYLVLVKESTCLYNYTIMLYLYICTCTHMYISPVHMYTGYSR